MSDTPLPPINFTALAEALLARAEVLVPLWLPGGEVCGHEYVCADLSGGKGRSCSVNLVTGRWADFAADVQGGDLVSLYAAVHGLSAGKAALQVAAAERLEDVAGLVRAGRTPAQPAPAGNDHFPDATKMVASKARSGEGWSTVAPVPAVAGAPTFWHAHRSKADLVHTAQYRVGDDLYGYVCRFRTSDGGKDTLPHTYCRSARDGAMKWHWRQWDEPRPLYLPGHALPKGRTLVVVEGEIKAEVLQALLEAAAPGVYCVVSWSGGCKAWQKAGWAWLAGCDVLLWADCDAKREKLSRAELLAVKGDDAARAALQASKPLLPEAQQPGMCAMLGIGALLRDAHGCRVSVLPIPAPGTKPDGWDARDAIEVDGWTGEDVLAFLGRAQPLPCAAAGGGGAQGGSGDGPAAADPKGGDAFAQHLLWLSEQMDKPVHKLPATRALVIAALRKAPALAECLGFDELRDGPVTVRPWPWRQECGPLADQDDLRCGDWIVSTYGTASFSRAALAEALETVADERRFHPWRDWLQAQAWDGRTRIDKWLLHVLGHDVEALPPKLRRYLELVGRYVLLGHVKRVMQPGCKFDYSVVLEGRTGAGKSSLVKVLIGEEYFSDTHFDIGSGKDGMEQLCGILAYELSEMTAFRRADSEAVKQFFSSASDRYRGAYGRYVREHPRQCVIWCTTNKRQYLFDVTGNRRYWPVSVDRRLNVDWVGKWRGQLFAEAFALIQAGERWWPTPQEEEIYFKPQQLKRLVETSVQGRLWELLTRPGSYGNEGEMSRHLSAHRQFVTVQELVVALGADPGKSSVGLEQTVRDWLNEHGWVYGRESQGQRRRGYQQPAVWPPVLEDEDLVAGAAAGMLDDCAGAPGDGAFADGGMDDGPF